MRVLRCIRNGRIITYAVNKGIAYRLDLDATEALVRYVRDGTILGDVVNLDIEGLIRHGEVNNCRLTMPLDPPEVWGAGITYEIARARYSEERVASIMGKTIYELVYEAERPELFFKGTASRCVGPNEPIGVRSDSAWTLPEPELGVVITSDGTVLGYTVSNDVSARDIEAENPLYLPQSKIYKGSCALGPVVVTPDEVDNPYNLDIELRIVRRGSVIYEGRANTSRMRRRIEELIKYLIRDNPVPTGTVLMTGTGIVPGREYGLEDGDVVEITISKIGTLRNPVVKLH